jgi:acyl carrier protein
MIRRNIDSLQIIYEALEVVNRQLPKGQRLDKNPETVIIGRGQGLDSLGFINFIVTIEQKLEQYTGTAVSLADIDQQGSSPGMVYTIKTFAEYLGRKAGEANAGN